ncbi:MAG: site-2 protease family protein [Patescibacteria group bacterium]|nr:site-2 protease family protein [Patescibacteria group bacterium]MDD5121749.1 site-2 protease family protein [Patescibacteria group bacterium]MDD5222179.1 site-2 protease family protein [Patescibacteria group bacterium]MDD5396399.1 site-2 protease family protein [Patescibacteria group bacterium]
MLIALAIIISLSLIVFIHELGHFIVGRLFKVRVEEFGFGYPPRLFGLTKVGNKNKFFFGRREPKEEHGTIYSFNWIPFGGFNRLKGEEAGGKKESDSFSFKPWWQRLLITLSGAGMNIILAAILLAITSGLGSYQEITPEILNSRLVIKDIRIQLIAISPNSPASISGLKVNDKIINIDSQAPKEVVDIQNYFKDKVGKTIKIIVERNNQQIELSVQPKPANQVFPDETSTGGVIGVAISKVGRVYYPIHLAVWSGISKTFLLLGSIVQGFYLFFKELIFHHKMIAEAAGVVGLAAMTADAAKMGIVYLMQFVAVVSLLIAVTQLIPFPALDGGRGVFFVIEGIFRKPVKPSIENAINGIGFTLLLILIIYVTYNDIMKLIVH